MTDELSEPSAGSGYAARLAIDYPKDSWVGGYLRRNRPHDARAASPARPHGIVSSGTGG